MQPDNNQPQNNKPLPKDSSPDNFNSSYTQKFKPTVTPPQQSSPAVNNVAPENSSIPNQPSSTSPPKKAFFKRAKLIPIIIGVALLLCGGAAAAYFVVVVPNSPQNVWDKSLENTAQGLDKLAEYTKQQKDVKGAKTSGSFKVESGGIVVDGNFEGATYEKNGSFKADVGAAGARVNVEVLTTVPDNSKNPDIYFKLTGLKGISSLLGISDPSSGQLLAEIDGKWYVVDHTLLDQVEASASQAEAAENAAQTLSSDDIYAIQAVIAQVNRDYLFTTDPSKSVLVISTVVGKETVDGRKMYHYKVTVNKEHLKSYVTAMKDELKKTKLGELYKSEGKSFEEVIGFDSILKSIDEMKTDETADVWADIDTKLIRKVRFSDKANDKSYVEFALNYNSGSVYPFVVTLKGYDESGEGEAILKAELDIEKDTLNLEANVDIQMESQKTTATLKALVETNNTPIEFKKPEGAVSVYELLGGLMPGAGIPESGLLPAGSAGLGNFDL